MKEWYIHIFKVHMRKFDCRHCPAQLGSMLAHNEHVLKYHKGKAVEEADKQQRRTRNVETDENGNQPTIKFRKLELKEKQNDEADSSKGTESKNVIPNGNWDCLVCGVALMNYDSLRDHLKSEHISKRVRWPFL